MFVACYVSGVSQPTTSKRGAPKHEALESGNCGAADVASESTLLCCCAKVFYLLQNFVSTFGTLHLAHPTNLWPSNRSLIGSSSSPLPTSARVAS